MKLLHSSLKNLAILPTSSDGVVKGESILAIPYNTSKTPFQEHGLNETIVIFFFLLLAIAIYWFLRKKGINQYSFTKDKKIKIIERTKVTTHSSILLVQFNNRFFLMSQSADNLSLISEVDMENN